MSTNIEWTDETWNPTTGCTKISDGCKNCYIERTPAFRIAGKKFVNGKIPLELYEGRLDAPLHWKKPRRIFVNSMSDLFHEDVPYEFIDRVFAVMQIAKWHTFQVLTKRAERMRKYMACDRGPVLENERTTSEWWINEAAVVGDVGSLRGKLGFEAGSADAWPLSNVILGVSVENKKHGLPRIEHLRRTPAAVRMLSIEPLLEDLGEIDLTGIGWVIVGGESGPGARPCHPDWVRPIRDLCVKVGVPFFWKQWGEWADLTNEPDGSELHQRSTCDEILLQSGEVLGAGYRNGKESGGMIWGHDWKERGAAWMGRVGKKAAGRLLDGRTWDEMPEMKAVPA